MRNDFEELRKKMLESAKQGIKEAYTSEEYALIQAINAYNETSKSYNLMFERLTEWYGIYFPELQISNPKTLADLTLATANEIDHDTIRKLINDDKSAEDFYKKAKSTIGRKMNEDEKSAVMGFAKTSNEMQSNLQSLEKYIKIASNRLLPNTTFLTDEKIAAELLSKAHSLEKMATMPASTIQLLGAEKSLFKHIKFGSKPPKYGVLFKMPEISSAPKEIRGRIARVYATKICIAVKADYFTKNFIAKDLKKDMDDTIKNIKSQPIVPKKEVKREFKRSFDKGGFSRPGFNRPRNNFNRNRGNKENRNRGRR
ncbi:MAG: NOP58 family protein [Candidatus Marsarchaeota archaeon]|nr:NOP58 family protein [Candidatus Marsarchaeota archaeon]